jgi:2-polyprenyl-3-methyl-5-hydroxy-6-metoxy-1,4-benzoquinol methylase
VAPKTSVEQLHGEFWAGENALDAELRQSAAPLAQRAVAEACVEIEVVEAGIEAMPLADGAADWIWCRDVLVHVDLERGLPECAGKLRPTIYLWRRDA